MFKSINIFFIVIALVILTYIAFPSPGFPTPPPNSEQSTEPADTETSLRRAYFTDLNREEVINHYNSQFDNKLFFPTLRLNYPPEEAQSIIRDQTRSTYLEELVHPFRESLYINGFEPQSEKDTILINGRRWEQKITVRYVPSEVFFRIMIMFSTLVLAYLLVREYMYAKRG